MTPDDVVGRRFVADFRVVAVAPAVIDDPDERVVVLHMFGERCEISFGELRQLIESGFVVETVDHR